MTEENKTELLDDGPLFEAEALDEGDVVDEDEDNDLEASKASKEEAIAKHLTSISEKVDRMDESQALAKIVSDPLVREVLEARRLGREVEVVGKDDRSAGDASEPELVDYDALTNSELVREILKNVPLMIGDEIAKKLQPVQSDVQDTKTYIQKRQESLLKQDIERAVSDHEDFEDYRNEMVHLSNENPKLSVEQVYLLAKHQKGGFEETDKRVESERATSSSSSPARKRLRQLKTKPGPRGFAELIDAALD